MKRRSVAKSRAASLKALRTRQRMKEARQQDRELVIQLANDLLHQAAAYDPHGNWPAYMKRALPLPKFNRD